VLTVSGYGGTISIVKKKGGNQMSLQVYRKKLGMTQAELARRAGISLVMVRAIEGGRRTGSVKTLKKLATILGVTMDELISDTKNK